MCGESRMHGVKEGKIWRLSQRITFLSKENVNALYKELNEIVKRGIQQDIEENGIDAIIKRELNNYECQYTGDIEIVVKALKDYGITYDQVLVVFRSVGGVQ